MESFLHASNNSDFVNSNMQDSKVEEIWGYPPDPMDVEELEPRGLGLPSELICNVFCIHLAIVRVCKKDYP